MAPSQLSIATSSLQRLVKEESSYHKELEQQEARLQKLESESGDENAEYMIKQEQKAIQETKRLFPELKTKIKAAMEGLEQKLEAVKAGDGASVEEITKAKEAVSQAKTSYREIA